MRKPFDPAYDCALCAGFPLTPFSIAWQRHEDPASFFGGLYGGTRTGRTYSLDPAKANGPRTGRWSDGGGPEMQGLVKRRGAGPLRALFDVDYSKIEMRIMAQTAAAAYEPWADDPFRRFYELYPHEWASRKMWADGYQPFTYHRGDYRVWGGL